MVTKVSYPEFRQLREDSQEDSCRLSGHKNGSSVGIKTTQRRPRRMFTIQTNSISNKKGVLERWTVISSGKRSVVIRYLFLKLIYDNLTSFEKVIFLSFREVTSDIQILFALKAMSKKIKRRTIRKILETLELGKKPISRNEYQSLQQILLTYKVTTNPPIEKPKPYSGYSKGYKDGKSSKRKFIVEEFGTSPIEPSPFIEDEIIIS